MKRLRLAAVDDVDETDPDYIKAKQEQQRKFKGRLESIFAKFGDMHESMSDEIDMTSNKIVVDRGHLRRIDRQMRRDRNAAKDVWQEVIRDEPEEEGKSEDSEDELAPTQLPKIKKDSENSNAPQSATKSQTAIPTLPQHLVAQRYIPQVPATPNPAAQLLQFVQFPTTPAGQQAQNSFYATLTQTINQAVQQAVAPLVSSFIQKTPHLQLPYTTITTPVPKTDLVAPPTDPKWFFPPLPAKQDQPEPQTSSPIASNSRISNPSFAEHAQVAIEQDESEFDEAQPEADEPQVSSPPMIASAALARGDFRKRQRKTSPRVETQNERKKRRQPRKYIFTHEDDVFITKKKLVDGWTWNQIISSKHEWCTWPRTTFWQHWAFRLKGRNLHLEASETAESEEQDSPDQRHEVGQNQLLTPSWSEHEEEKVELVIQNSSLTAVNVSSSAHYDEDDLDLLSLHGGDQDELPLAMEEVDEIDHETFFPDADEDIIPSIEVTDFVDEDDLQRGLLEDSEGEEEETIIAETQESITAEIRESSVYIKTEEGLSSPIYKRKRARITYQAVADTESAEEDENTLLTNEPLSSLPMHYTCQTCNAMLKTEKNLERHIAKQHPPPTITQARSQSLDLIVDDDIELPFTPSTKPVKSENDTSSPARNFLFSTPARVHARSDNPSSGVRSASGLSRRAFLKQTKQAWAKNKTPKGLQKRQSFNALPRKRVWEDGGRDSEDELA